VRDLLLFPYVEGLGFIYQFRKRRPWAAMSAIYSDPPRSTTQILHPEKYFDRREDPVAVAIPDLSRLLPGSHLVSDDDLGEFSLGAVLALHLGDTEGPRPGAGWRGRPRRLARRPLSHLGRRGRALPHRLPRDRGQPADGRRPRRSAARLRGAPSSRAGGQGLRADGRARDVGGGGARLRRRASGSERGAPRAIPSPGSRPGSRRRVAGPSRGRAAVETTHAPPAPHPAGGR